jgi:hypothetical protein
VVLIHYAMARKIYLVARCIVIAHKLQARIFEAIEIRHNIKT